MRSPPPRSLTLQSRAKVVSCSAEIGMRFQSLSAIIKQRLHYASEMQQRQYRNAAVI